MLSLTVERARCDSPAPLSVRGEEACGDGVLRPLGSLEHGGYRPTQGSLAQVRFEGSLEPSKQASQTPRPRHWSFL